MRKPSAFLSLIQRYPQLFTWVCIYVVFYLVSSSHQISSVAFILTNMAVTPMILAWAIVRYLLAPKMLHLHRISFFLSCALILVLLAVICATIDAHITTELHDQKLMVLPERVEAAMQRGETRTTFLHAKYTFLLLTTMAITAISWLLDERKRLNILQREQRTRMELKNLRAQINPHFLFNALNCIYSLTMLKDDAAPDSVMKLSDMLRYVTDDCRSDLVTLQKEVSYIQNYIDFQQIRMEHPADITFDVSMFNPAMKVPPMLLQPMVENCFKHSRIIDHPNGFIHLSLRQENKLLIFEAENSKPEDADSTKDKERTGIGLQNVQQRLSLLFREKASLQIKETDNSYRIELCIKS